MCGTGFRYGIRWPATVILVGVSGGFGLLPDVHGSGLSIFYVAKGRKWDFQEGEKGSFWRPSRQQ